MLTSKQRAQLRSLASNMDVIMQVGKSGVTEAMAKTVSDALEARELIKMRVLENSDMARLKEQVRFCVWEKRDENHTVVRFATSWATSEEDIAELWKIVDNK